MYLLTVLTIVFLIGLIVFLASLSVFWRTDSVAEPTVDSIENSTPFERFGNWTPHHNQNELSPREVVTTAVPPTATRSPISIAPTSSSIPTPFGSLIIPKLGVSQPVIPIFVRNGQWDISEIGSDIGHLETTGRYPYDSLAMTFTGHVTLPWPDIAGPFADLVFLEHNEEIIYRWDGTDYVYAVERIFRVAPSAVDFLYEQDGEMLILVTCSGWNFVDRAYDERLVTRAVLVREETSPAQ